MLVCTETMINGGLSNASFLCEIGLTVDDPNQSISLSLVLLRLYSESVLRSRLSSKMSAINFLCWHDCFCISHDEQLLSNCC